MDPLIAIAAAAGGYLVGSLSFARIVTALAGYGKGFPEDAEARIEESEKTIRLNTVSATSVSIKAGPRLGFVTYVLDVLKVFIPVLVLKKVFPDEPYFLVWAAAAVVGHIWPVYHKFKGGGGMSAIFGGLFAIDWLGVFVTAIGGMVVGLAVLRDVYLIYYSGLVLLVPWLWFRTKSVPLLIYALAVNVLFIVASMPAAKRFYRLKRTDPAWRNPRVAWKISAMGRGILKMMDKLGLGKKKDREEGGQP
jgi:glycerol-3-phosphate acyltransferase PlsY